MAATTVPTSAARDAARPNLFARAWARLSLARQFIVAGAVVLILGMFAIGFWVTREIEEGVTHNTASSTALYMDSVVAPLVQGLASDDSLSAQARLELESVLGNSPLGQRLLSFKIWKEGGLIAFSSREGLIGRTFPPTANLEAAWSGEVTAEFDTLIDQEDALERQAGVPLLEIYSPIREARTGRIIAVAEFYETATALQENLFWVSIESWAVVGCVTLAMMGLLSGIVVRGSQTIASQRRALEERVAALSTLLRQNEDLRLRVQRASSRVTELNERYLRRVSAELHDGPAQHLALASLRLDSLRPAISDRAAPDLDVVRDAVGDALVDIRNVCKGLTLPEVGRMSLADLLRSVTAVHERRCGTKVALAIDAAAAAAANLGEPQKICLYRFVQEGLNNAYRHAGGAGQAVRCSIRSGMLELTVSDEGPGMAVGASRSDGEAGLGLAGLRERVESLGGSFALDSSPGAGTRLTMRMMVEGSGPVGE